MIGWFRVPLDAAKALTGDHKATRTEAMVDLLGRWHLGGNPGVRELMRAWDWSGDRVTKFVAEMGPWAAENGAMVPPNKIGQQPDSNRTVTGHSDVGATPAIQVSPDSNRTAIGQRPDASCARVPFSERDKRPEERDTPLAPPSGAVPPQQEIHPCPTSPTTAPTPAAPAPTRAPSAPGASPRALPSPTPSTEPATAPTSECSSDSPKQDSPSATSSTDALPKWVPARKDCGGHAREAVMALVVDAATAAHERAKRPEACGTAAKAVLALWRCLGTPSPAELAEQIALVAVWARTSTDSLAENDIRGTRPNGERWGTDRSRDLSTLCVQDRWDARLTAAEAWHARGRIDAAPPSPRRAGERPVRVPDPIAVPGSDRQPWEGAIAFNDRCVDEYRAGIRNERPGRRAAT